MGGDTIFFQKRLNRFLSKISLKIRKRHFLERLWCGGVFQIEFYNFGPSCQAPINSSPFILWINILSSLRSKNENWRKIFLGNPVDILLEKKIAYALGIPL